MTPNEIAEYLVSINGLNYFTKVYFSTGHAAVVNLQLALQLTDLSFINCWFAASTVTENHMVLLCGHTILKLEPLPAVEQAV